ncbi:hypothetical protein OAV88_01490 [bacterium]|nr:hypothetical protein [bacterium]
MTSIYEKAAKDVFEKKSDSQTISMSFVEVAGDSVNDLLNGFESAQLLSASDGSFQAYPVVEPVVSSLKDLLAFVQYACSVRNTQATGVHDASSRSHAVLRIYINGDDNNREGTLTLVDLAGSEHRIDSMHHNAQLRKECAQINASLMALKKCVMFRAASSSSSPRRTETKHQHVYRSSKLTMCLKNSFSRRDAKTVVIATVSPSSKDTEHSLSTLRQVSIMIGTNKGKKKRSSHLQGGFEHVVKIGRIDVLAERNRQKAMSEKQQKQLRSNGNSGNSFGYVINIVDVVDVGVRERHSLSLILHILNTQTHRYGSRDGGTAADAVLSRKQIQRQRRSRIIIATKALSESQRSTLKKSRENMRSSNVLQTNRMRRVSLDLDKQQQQDMLIDPRLAVTRISRSQSSPIEKKDTEMTLSELVMAEDVRSRHVEVTRKSRDEFVVKGSSPRLLKKSSSDTPRTPLDTEDLRTKVGHLRARKYRNTKGRKKKMSKKSTSSPKPQKPANFDLGDWNKIPLEYQIIIARQYLGVDDTSTTPRPSSSGLKSPRPSSSSSSSSSRRRRRRHTSKQHERRRDERRHQEKEEEEEIYPDGSHVEARWSDYEDGTVVETFDSSIDGYYDATVLSYDSSQDAYRVRYSSDGHISTLQRNYIRRPRNSPRRSKLDVVSSLAKTIRTSSRRVMTPEVIVSSSRIRRETNNKSVPSKKNIEDEFQLDISSASEIASIEKLKKMIESTSSSATKSGLKKRLAAKRAILVRKKRKREQEKRERERLERERREREKIEKKKHSDDAEEEEDDLVVVGDVVTDVKNSCDDQKRNGEFIEDSPGKWDENGLWAAALRGGDDGSGLNF